METQRAKLAAAARRCEDASMRHRFTNNQVAIDTSLAVEAFLSAHAPWIYQFTGRDRNELLHQCASEVAQGLDVLGKDGFWSRLSLQVIEWLTQRSKGDGLDEVAISDVVPCTLGFLFSEWLHENLRESNVEAIEMLLTSPTFLDLFSDQDRAFALTHAIANAASSGNRDAVNVLVAHGANVDVEINVSDRQPIDGLQRIVENGKAIVGDGFLLTRVVSYIPAIDDCERHADTVRWLLGLGVDVNVSGTTALHMVAERQLRPDLVRVLFEHGLADVDARDAAYQTPLMRAVVASESVPSLSLSILPNPQRVATARALLSLGANPNAQDTRGKTPLHLAPFTFGIRAHNVLLEHGADPNIADRDGRTPLHRLREVNVTAYELAKVLTTSGANVHARMVDGRTPLHTLVAGDNWTDEDAVIHAVWLLMKRGADPNAADESGVTPISICLQRQAHRDEMILAILRDPCDNDDENDEDFDEYLDWDWKYRDYW